MLKIISVLILIGILSCGCSKNGSKEKEPNNSSKNANEIELSRPVTGYLHDDSDTDYFKLEVDKQSIASITLSPIKGVNHALLIFREIDGKPFLLKTIDDSRKSSPEEFPNMGLKPGIYYFQVAFGERDSAKGNEKNSYQLKITAEENSNEEFEPNDIRDYATPITSSVEYKSFFSPAFNKLNDKDVDKFREYDYYSISVMSPSSVIDVSVSGVPQVNSVLQLKDSLGNLIASADAGLEGAGELIKNRGISEAGIYYIVLYSKNYEKNNEVPYLLSATVKGYDLSNEMESNDTIDSANQILGKDINGLIYPEGDIDIYVYQPDVSKQLSVKAIPPQSVDIKLKVSDIDGKTLFDVNNNPAGVMEVIPNIITDKKIFITVSAGGASFDPDIQYNLILEEYSLSDGSEKEPNDAKEDANIVAGQYIQGYINRKNDTDYFFLQYGKKVNTAIKFRGVKNTNIEISVADNFGYVAKTEKSLSGSNIEIKETINGSGYLIIKGETPSAEPYGIEIIQLP